MERKTGKLGAALAAVALGVGMPALASAQSVPDASMQWDTTTNTSVDGAIANLAANTAALANAGTLDESAIVPVSLSDMEMDGASTAKMLQAVNPGDAATLQQTLGNVSVTTQQSPSGVSLANYLTSMNIDPHSVVAVDVGNDGTVTLFYQ